MALYIFAAFMAGTVVGITLAAMTYRTHTSYIYDPVRRAYRKIKGCGHANSDLLIACETARELLSDLMQGQDDPVIDQLNEAIAEAKGN